MGLKRREGDEGKKDVWRCRRRRRRMEGGKEDKDKMRNKMENTGWLNGSHRLV